MTGVTISIFSIELGILITAISISTIFVVTAKAKGKFLFEAYGNTITLAGLLFAYLAGFDFYIFEKESSTPLIFFSFAIFISAAPSLIYNISELRFERVTTVKETFSIILDQYRERLAFGVHELISVLGQHIFIVLCGIFLSLSELAVFRVSQLYLLPLMLLPASLSQVLLKNLSAKNHTLSFTTMVIAAALIPAIAWILFPSIEKILSDASVRPDFTIYLVYSLP